MSINCPYNSMIESNSYVMIEKGNRTLKIKKHQKAKVLKVVKWEGRTWVNLSFGNKTMSWKITRNNGSTINLSNGASQSIIVSISGANKYE